MDGIKGTMSDYHNAYPYTDRYSKGTHTLHIKKRKGKL